MAGVNFTDQREYLPKLKTKTMEKLELKHLAPYLPYDLECHFQIAPHFSNEVNKLNQENLWSVNDFSSKIEPILRPLSDLTKEIEHNGEKFVPIEIIGQDFIRDGFFEDGVFGWGETTGGDDEQDYSLTLIKEDEEIQFNIWCGNEFENGYVVEEINIHFKYWQLLFEWHFDVFGLIEKGLAIDINSIENVS